MVLSSNIIDWRFSGRVLCFLIKAKSHLTFLNLRSSILSHFCLYQQATGTTLGRISVRINCTPFLSVRVQTNLMRFQMTGNQFSVLIANKLHIPFLFARNMFMLLCRLHVAEATKDNKAVRNSCSQGQAFRNLSAPISVAFCNSASNLFVCIRSFLNVHSLNRSRFLNSLQACLYHVTISHLTAASSGVVVISFLSDHNGHVKYN